MTDQEALLAHQKRVLQDALLPLLEEFERETGLRISEIGVNRTYTIGQLFSGPIQYVSVRVHSL